MRTYRYQVKDYSILTPPFKKFVVSPMINLIPYWVPANYITIVSNMFFYLALVLSMNKSWLGMGTFPVVAALLLLYLIGDHLDGMQAKRTATSSPLGEFCDHYLDAFNNGILMAIFFFLYDITDLYLVASLLTASYLAHASVFYEQNKTGWLIFEKWGSLEAVFISILILLLSGVGPVYDLLMMTIFHRYTLIELILLFTGIGTLLTMVKTLKRTGSVSVKFWVFVLLLPAIAWLTMEAFKSILALSFILTMYSSLYIGKLMRGHLVDGMERLTDLIIPIILSVYFVFNKLIFGHLVDSLSIVSDRHVFIKFPQQEIFAWFLSVLSVYLILNLIYQTVKPMASYWLWKNPIPVEHEA